MVSSTNNFDVLCKASIVLHILNPRRIIVSLSDVYGIFKNLERLSRTVKDSVCQQLLSQLSDGWYPSKHLYNLPV